VEPGQLAALAPPGVQHQAVTAGAAPKESARGAAPVAQDEPESMGEWA
jgi:hypothetical protein